MNAINKNQQINLKIQYNTIDIDWNRVVYILKEAGMAYKSEEIHKRAFTNSHTVIFILDNNNLIAFGRAISDGEYQAAIYDVAVLPSYQGLGIGKLIIQNIINKLPNCNFILYASPGKESFYKKLNFRKMKTGMALFLDKDGMQKRKFTE